MASTAESTGIGLPGDVLNARVRVDGLRVEIGDDDDMCMAVDDSGLVIS